MWTQTAKRILLLVAVLQLLAISGNTNPFRASQSLDPELGIVYRPPSVRWDGQQWNAIFGDPAPPMGWAVLPVGRESCDAVNQSWLNNVKRKGLKPAILFTPFLAPSDFIRTVDCASRLGFKRAVMDEYISYQTKTNGRPLCTVLSEVRSIYSTVKRQHPNFELGINDTWHTWMVDLARGQNDSCGGYPHFRYDMTGISVLSKYGNPAQGVCDHPTASEMEEQLIDLKSTVKDHSKTGRIFVWQLNLNWYPGGEKVLQLFRSMKAVYGWERFPLFGPTTEHPTEENWGYTTRGGAENCASAGFEWFIPARRYLLRIVEGQRTTMALQAPAQAARGSTVSVTGRLSAPSGLASNTVELQQSPPPGSPQTFRIQVRSPSGALLAFVGVRANAQLPNPIKGPAQFTVQRIQMFQTGGTRNLVTNSDFNDGLRNWLASGSAQIGVMTEGSEKSLLVNSTAGQTASVTNLLPIIVSSGRDYTIQFDARVLQESRNSAYFYVSWGRPDEIRRDRMFVTFPQRQTVAVTTTRSDGSFQFNWAPTETGNYSVSSFFRGTQALQPAFASTQVTVR